MKENTPQGTISNDVEYKRGAIAGLCRATAGGGAQEGGSHPL